jgi:hypothetical protein
LQGTFEKIRFQRLVGDQALQLTNLLPQLTLAGVRRWSIAVLDRLQLISPLVEQAPVNAQLLRECNDVLATL